VKSGPTVRRFWNHPRIRVGREVGLYLAIAVAGTWPLAAQLHSSFSIGFEGEATVPLLNLWTLWWNADRLGSGLSGYWNAPIFYPETRTFAFSEAQPTMMAVAPIIGITGNPVLAYNVYQLAVLTLNGWVAQRLLQRLGYGPCVATSGGVMCQLLPFVWWQSGVIQLTTLFGALWTILAMIALFDPDERLRLAPRRDGLNSLWRLAPGTGWSPSAQSAAAKFSLKRSLNLGVAFGMTYLMCNYWGLYLLLIATPASVWFWNGRVLTRGFWSELSVAGIVAGLLLFPVVRVQRSLAEEHKWSRETNWIIDLSAHSRDYLDTPETAAHNGEIVPDPEGNGELAPKVAYPWSRTHAWEPSLSARNNLWPLGGGLLKLGLAPLGLVASLLLGRRRWGLFAATLGGLAYFWSLGPTVGIALWFPGVRLCPYEIARRFIPGFGLIRSPFRFAIFVQLAIVWLCVELLDVFNPSRWKIESTEAPQTGSAGGATRVLKSALALMLGLPALLLVTFEVFPRQSGIYQCPPVRSVPAWILWLRENSAPTDAIICLPFPTGYTVGDYEETAIWMYWGMFHHRPLVNGYSGFFPLKFQKFKEDLSQFYRGENEPPDVYPELRRYSYESPGILGVNASGARFVIVPRYFASRDDVWQHPLTKFRWSWVAGDEEHELDIYEILQPEPQP